MAQMQGTRTEENLENAFSEEAQANRRYVAFARQAEMEGYPQLSRLFRAVSESENVHAQNMLRALGAVRDSRANLMEGLRLQGERAHTLYPQLVKTAEGEDMRTARVAFDYAGRVEQIHIDLLQQALQQLDNLPAVDYYVCPVCGNTVIGRPPESCPICGTPGTAFMRIA